MTKKELSSYLEKVFEIRISENSQSNTGKNVRVLSKQDGSLIREGESMQWHVSRRFFTFEYIYHNKIEEVYHYDEKVMYGFAPLTHRWHVWTEKGAVQRSFRAGYVVKETDDAYEPPTEDLFIQRALRFWRESDIYTDVTVENRTDKSFDIRCIWSSDPMVVKRAEARGAFTMHHYNLPDEYGRGVWTAKSDADAKEVAMAYIRNLTR